MFVWRFYGRFGPPARHRSIRATAAAVFSANKFENAVSLAAGFPQDGFAVPRRSDGPGRLVRQRSLALEDRAMDKAFSMPPDTAELARLVAAVAQQRDKAAFARLFDYFAPRLKTYLMRLGANANAAEDMAQEAMLILWRKAESFDPSQANVRTWVFTIARNKRIDALRRERRPEFDANDPALVPATPTQADENFAALEHEAVLRDAIGALPEEQAALLRVCYYEDKSHRQIAREMDIPLGTVKSRLRLALARLRTALRGRM